MNRHFDAPQQPIAELQSRIELEGRGSCFKSSPEASLRILDMATVTTSQHSHIIPCTQKIQKRKPDRSLRYGFKARSKSEILEDGYDWRIYGSEFRRGNSNPSKYYRCSHSHCHVRKRVERDAKDTEIVITTYEGKHNHESSFECYIGNHPLFKALQSALEDKVINCADYHLEQLSMARGATFSVPELYTSTLRSDASVQSCVDQFGEWIRLHESKCSQDSIDQMSNPFTESSDEDLVDDLTIDSSAESADISSKLIDQILNTKADKADFDLGQLVAQIDALLVYYCTLLRTKNTIHQKLQDLPTVSDASNFANQVSKHVKLIANQIKLYSGDKHRTCIGVLNSIIAIRNIHWTAVGFLVLGAALQDVHTINRNKEECSRLFMSMSDLSKVILQLQDHRQELHTKLKESIHLIVIGATLVGLLIQKKGFGRAFNASMAGEELQKLITDIDDMCKSLISHMSAPMLEGLRCKACQNNKLTTVHRAMDALAEGPKIFALHKHSLSFLETTIPGKLVKCSPSNVKIHSLLSQRSSAELQRRHDFQRTGHWRLEPLCFSSFWFANFNLNRVHLELSSLKWLVRVDFSDSNLPDNHLSGHELRFEANNSTYHPLDFLPQHLKDLLSLQYLGLKSTFRLSRSVINQISTSKGTASSVVNQSVTGLVIDQILELIGITISDVEHMFNEKRYNNSVREQISNEKKMSSSAVDQITNKNKTCSSEVNSATNIVRAGNSVIELLEMIVSNFSWSMDSSQEVLNLKNILFLPRQIGDLLGVSDQDLQSTFHLPQHIDLSKLKVINMQNFICIRQQVKELLPLKALKLQSSLYLPQHSRGLLTLKVLKLQTTLLDISPSSLDKLENLLPVVFNKCDKTADLQKGLTYIEFKPKSKQVSAQRKKNSIFLICYDWEWIKSLVDKLVKSFNAGGVTVIVIDLFHWEMTDKKSFSSKNVSEGTNIHIPIFSKNNYFWHLEQWLCICRPNSIISPLFYEVNEDIRYLYDKALNKLANMQDSVVGISSSINVPPQASFLSGWSSLDYRTDWRLVKRVVFDILEMLNNLPLHLPLHAVGLEERIEDMADILEMESDRLEMVVAICGMGGIGKTTLAKAILNSIGHRFQACSFVALVKEKELCKSQEQILKDLLRKDILVKTVDHGKALMKAHLRSIRALVVLDDIDQSGQLEALSVDWLGPGSRLLLVLRDTELLSFVHANKIYHMARLGFEQSVELFTWHAFLRADPDEGYEDMSKMIAKACQGNPLLLEVAGASLYDRAETSYWDESVRYLERSIDEGICKRLCVSMQALTYLEIEIFLDIACFFVGEENLETALRFWEAIGRAPKKALEKLIQNSLVRIDDKKQFVMHYLLRDMGRTMVADNSSGLGEHRRLWRPEEAQVITKCLGTMSVQGCSIAGAETDNIILQAEPFAPMANLQLLWISGEVERTDFLNLCSGLRWLRWNSPSLTCLPSEWSVKQLTILDLSSIIRESPGTLRELWSERSLSMEFENLNVLRLSSAQYLERLPNFSAFPALTVLDLEDCPNLTSIPDSIGILGELKCLNLSWCRNLVKLPDGISKLSSLEKLSLSHCFSLKELPSAIEELMALKELDIGFARHIEKLPNFSKLVKLEILILAGCLSIRFLPDPIGKLYNLKELDMQFLGLIQKLPSLGNLLCLKKLIVSGCESLRNLPESVGELRCLQYLEMNNCSSIDYLPEEFGDLVHLEELYMNDCPRFLNFPSHFENLANLRILELKHNPNLMQLPSSFSKLSSLVWFDASDCNLSEGLHEEIGDLLPLGVLNLENNFFCQLPPSICKLTNLTKLNLNNCRYLEEIPTLPQGIVELDVGNCTQLTRLPCMLDLKRLITLILCSCNKLIGLPELSSCECLTELNISKCVNIRSLDVVERLSSLKTLYFGGSSVSVSNLNQYIEDMPRLEEICIHANGVPQWLELKTGDHCLNDDIFTDLLYFSVKKNAKFVGVFIFLVVNFMHAYYTPGSPQNSMELAIIADNQESVWVTVLGNRQNVEGDQLYICMYRDTHLLVRRMEAVDSISIRAKGRNIQVRECGVHLLYDGTGDGYFQRLVKALNLLADSYTAKTSDDEGDTLDDIEDKSRDEEPDGDLYDYGYASSEGEY